MSSFDDPRWDDTRDGPTRGRASGLDRDPRDLDRVDPRDVFTQGLELPRGLDREPVSVGNEQYHVRSSEVRTLATVGAFRVVPIDDLRDRGDRLIQARGDPGRAPFLQRTLRMDPVRRAIRSKVGCRSVLGSRHLTSISR